MDITRRELFKMAGVAALGATVGQFTTQPSVANESTEAVNVRGESWAIASGNQGGGVAALAADVVVDDAKSSCFKKKKGSKE